MKRVDAFLLCAAALLGSSACEEKIPDSGTVMLTPLPDGGLASADGGPTVRPVGNEGGAPMGEGGTSPASDGGQADAGGDASGPVSSGDPEFDACYAMTKPICLVKEMTTAELLETPCRALTNIALPLTNGMTYGPMTVMAGPYGGKMEWNEGGGTMFANEVNIAEEICVPIGIDTFAEPEAVVSELKNLRGLDWSLYTIFRPACFKKGEKYPVITWANGTCGEIHGYSVLLSTVASHGFVVIASNSTWTATPPTDTVQLRALDYAKALNEDPQSIYYQKLDLEHVGAEGHSQGAVATAFAAADPRIDAVLFWNTGASDEKPFLDISGDLDVVPVTPESMTAGVELSAAPGGWVYFHKIPETGGNATGHLTLMEQPERVVDLAVAWWKWQLKGDQEAKKMFVGENCGLCNKPDEFEYGHNSMLQ